MTGFLTRKEGDFAPYNIELEQALFGWALNEKTAIAFMQPHVAVEDFYDPFHQRIAERVFAKFAADKPVTPLTMLAAMKADPGVLEIGEAYFGTLKLHARVFGGLRDLERQVVDAARQVADLAMRRRAEIAILDATEMLNRGEDLVDCLEPITIVADSENERGDHASGSAMAVDVADQLLHDLDEPDPLKGLRAASTGIEDLDAVIGGLWQRNLVFVGGRPGMGKSIIGTTFAKSAAATGFVSDYLSLEMSKKELIARALVDIDYERAIQGGFRPIEYSLVQAHRRDKPRLSSDEITRLAEAREILQSDYRDWEIHDRDELTIDQIFSIMRAKKARIKKPQAIIVDHMHLVEPSGKYAGRKVDEISEITKKSKRMAKSLDAAVVLLAQLSRALDSRDDKAPQLSDFRDSGSIEQDGDVLIGANRPHYYLERIPKAQIKADDVVRHEMEIERTVNILDLGVLKNRHGATRNISCFIDVKSAAIRNVKPTSQAQLNFAAMPALRQLDALEMLDLDKRAGEG